MRQENWIKDKGNYVFHSSCCRWQNYQRNSKNVHNNELIVNFLEIPLIISHEKSVSILARPKLLQLLQTNTAAHQIRPPRRLPHPSREIGLKYHWKFMQEIKKVFSLIYQPAVSALQGRKKLRRKNQLMKQSCRSALLCWRQSKQPWHLDRPCPAHMFFGKLVNI